MAQSYLDRGVSPTKDDVKAAVRDQDKGLFPGSFCKINADLAGDPDWCVAVHADGAGTKSSLAYLMMRETGDTSWFRGIAQDSLVMNTDDLACVGAVDGFYLSNTIGRNAHRVSGDCIAEVIRGYDAVIANLRDQGIHVEMTGGETADVGDLVRTLIADSTVVVRMRKEQVFNATDIGPGLAIVGLSSTGQTIYEDKENSGMGSNGLTAARHMLLRHDYYTKYPETFSPTIDEDKIYGGPFLVDDDLPHSDLKVGEAILSPTRTYLPVLKQVFEQCRADIRGLIHCTGGGQVKCKDFGDSVHYVKDNLFPLPPLFRAIYETGQVPAAEMYQIFNMGHRMEIYCEPAAAETIIGIAAGMRLDARVIGRTEATTTGENKVTLRTELGEHHYE